MRIPGRPTVSILRGKTLGNFLSSFWSLQRSKRHNVNWHFSGYYRYPLPMRRTDQETRIRTNEKENCVEPSTRSHDNVMTPNRSTFQKFIEVITSQNELDLMLNWGLHASTNSQIEFSTRASEISWDDISTEFTELDAGKLPTMLGGAGEHTLDVSSSNSEYNVISIFALRK